MSTFGLDWKQAADEATHEAQPNVDDEEEKADHDKARRHSRAQIERYVRSVELVVEDVKRSHRIIERIVGKLEKLNVKDPHDAAVGRADAYAAKSLFDQSNTSIEMARHDATGKETAKLDALKQANDELWRESVHTLSQHIPIETGAPYVDQGAECDQPGSREGCFMTPERRQRAVIQLESSVDQAMENFGTALQNARLDHALSSEGGWGFVEEMVFGATTGVIIGNAVRAIRALKGMDARAVNEAKDWIAQGQDAQIPRTVSVDENAVEGALKEGSKGLRAHLKAGAKHSGRDGKDTFIKLVQDHISYVKGSVIDTLPQLDDVDIDALIKAYNSSEYHSVASYEARIAEMMTGFDRNLADIGKPQREGGAIRLVRLVANGDARLALVHREGTGKIANLPTTLGGPEYGEGRNIFLRFVDDEYGGYAEEYAEAQRETVVEEHVSAGGHGYVDRYGQAPRELNAWIKERSR